MPHLPLKPLWLNGRYQVEGQAPDGDSIRFIPAQPELLQGECFQKVRIHPDGGITLRLDGIDAPETHYLGQKGLGVLRQPTEWPDLASLALLNHLGFGPVLRRADETVIKAEPAALAGVIALLGADRFGRAVGLAFAGSPKKLPRDLTTEIIRHSANAHLVTQGLAYPTFYTDTHSLLLSEITRLAQLARQQKRGAWQVDASTRGFRWDSIEAITQSEMILPKLFRRLVDFAGLMQGNEPKHELFLQFKNQLALDVGVVTLLPQGAQVEFTDLLEERAGIMKLLVAPELILFPADQMEAARNK